MGLEEIATDERFLVTGRLQASLSHHWQYSSKLTYVLICLYCTQVAV